MLAACLADGRLRHINQVSRQQKPFNRHIKSTKVTSSTRCTHLSMNIHIINIITVMFYGQASLYRLYTVTPVQDQLKVYKYIIGLLSIVINWYQNKYRFTLTTNDIKKQRQLEKGPLILASNCVCQCPRVRRESTIVKVWEHFFKEKEHKSRPFSTTLLTVQCLSPFCQSAGALVGGPLWKTVPWDYCL